MTNEKRIEIEQQIVRKYVKAVEDAGFKIVAMDTGGGREAYRSPDIFEADECRLYLEGGAGKSQWLYFVYGNEPGEVLNDYTVGLEDTVAPVNSYADQWA